MELLELLDQNGAKTGAIKNKKSVHQDGDWHNIVLVCIINDHRELLMQLRALQKESHPNEWDISCAGHVSAGESLAKAAIRETKEELGLKVAETDLNYLFTIKNQSVLNNGTFIDNEFHNIYLIRLNLENSHLTLQKEEVAEIKWISLNELKSLVVNKTPGYVPRAKEYLELIDYLKGNL